MTDRAEATSLPDAAAIWARNLRRPEIACQYNQLLMALTEAVLDHSQTNGESESRMMERLEDAEAVLRNACYGVDANLGQIGKPAGRPGDVWFHRRDLLSEIKEGYKEDIDRIDRQELIGAAAMLVERPWLDCRQLEYILIDALVCDEIRKFGRSIIETAPGNVDGLGINVEATRERGLNAIGWTILRSRLKWWAIRLVALLVAPAAMFWFGVRAGIVWMVIVGGLVAAAYLLISTGLVLVGWLRWLLDKPRSKKPFEIKTELWDAMHAAYRTLDGAVLDPGRTLKALQDAAAKGAVWDGAIYGLLNRVAARNEHAWVTDDNFVSRPRLNHLLFM